MNPAEYFAGHDPTDVPTPVAVKVGGKVVLRSLSSILYAVPPPEKPDSLRRRMAELILRRVSAAGAITRDELLGDFSAEEIDQHFRPALRLAGVHRLGETL